jgi:hypothetical protein
MRSHVRVKVRGGGSTFARLAKSIEGRGTDTTDNLAWLAGVLDPSIKVHHLSVAFFVLEYWCRCEEIG